MRAACDLDTLAAGVRASRGLKAKRDIAEAMRRLGVSGLDAVRVGDDCAALADADGYLLFAIEGFINEFVAHDPWFAGWCGVMVNVSDIAAMGGVHWRSSTRSGPRALGTLHRSLMACAPRRRPLLFRSSEVTPTFAPSERNCRSPYSAEPNAC